MNALHINRSKRLMEAHYHQQSNSIDHYKQLKGLKSAIFSHHRTQSVWILYLHCIRQRLSQTEIAQQLNLNLSDMQALYELLCETQQKQAKH